MKKVKKKRDDDEMLPEYDFSGGVRGKYAKRFPRGMTLVALEPDVAKCFPDSGALNDFLRSVMKISAKRRRSA